MKTHSHIHHKPRRKTIPKTALMMALALFAAFAAQAALYQWSIPQEPGRRAYLWIPETCQRIRGLVVDMNNLTESAIIENAVVREVCAQERVGILWIAEGSWAASPLANDWGDPNGLSKDQLDVFNKALSVYHAGATVPMRDQAIATAKVMKLELFRQAGVYLDDMLQRLANESGYPEVRYAPLLIIGHSQTGKLAWEMPYYIPDRMWGALPIKTGVGGHSWEMPGATNMPGVPVMYLNQAEPDGGHASSPDGTLGVRQQDVTRLVSRVYDWGGSHFEMTDEMANLAALFIRKAAQYRLCDEIPATGYPKLKELKPEQGWLATSLLDPQQFPMAPEPQYKGDKAKAFWFFDEEMAKAVVGHHIADRKKKIQYVTVVSNGKELKPFTGSFGSVAIPFASGIDDGFTFKLTGAFLDTVPSNNPAEAKPAGHAASGKVLVKIAGGGSLAQVGEDTFRFRPGNMGFNGKALNCWLVATHPGDAEYARCNQPAWLWMPEKVTKGAAQTITFDKPANVTVRTKEMTLGAKASSGLPVEYFVVSGPAEVVGNKLRFTPIPPRAKMPVKVIVTAYQMGRPTAPLTQSAPPVERSFVIVASQEDILAPSPGNTTYFIDPAKGNDANSPGQPWRTFGRLNAVRLAPGDTVIIAPGQQEETLKPSGAGSAEKPVVIRFQPGVHILGIKEVMRLPMFISNSMDSTDPKPVGIYLGNVRNFRLEGGGVEGPEKTTILYDGRMVQIFNDHSENITFSGLVFDLKRPTVSEFRVLESGPRTAVIQVAEGSDYAVENEKFVWKGDWGQGYPMAVEAVPDEGRCQSTRMPRGWSGAGQTEAKATDLGASKVRLEFTSEGTGLTTGHHYQFRLIKRDVVAVHNARSKDIVFRDCDFYALPGMGLVSQFTENITYQRVNVAPQKGTLRTCAAWADIFHFSNCKGDILVDSCRLSGMQDDALNCHGTHLRIVGKPAANQFLMRFMHGQTYGFAAFQPGDEVAVINHDNLREYEGNPRRKVKAVERVNDKEWLLTLDAAAPAFEKDDVLDNITWYPNLTARNNHVSMDPVRGFLITTRGRVLVENNTFHRPAMAGILIEDDASGWFESGPVRDMLIRSNRFVRCGIAITPHTNSDKPGDWVHENIRIEDNEFYEGGNVSARNVKGLTFINNRAPERTVRLEANACTDVKLSNTPGNLRSTAQEISTGIEQ